MGAATWLLQRWSLDTCCVLLCNVKFARIRPWVFARTYLRAHAHAHTRTHVRADIAYAD